MWPKCILHYCTGFNRCSCCNLRVRNSPWSGQNCLTNRTFGGVWHQNIVVFIQESTKGGSKIFFAKCISQNYIKLFAFCPCPLNNFRLCYWMFAPFSLSSFSLFLFSHSLSIFLTFYFSFFLSFVSFFFSRSLSLYISTSALHSPTLFPISRSLFDPIFSISPPPTFFSHHVFFLLLSLLFLCTYLSSYASSCCSPDSSRFIDPLFSTFSFFSPLSLYLSFF